MSTLNWADLVRDAGESSSYEPLPDGDYDVVVVEATAKVILNFLDESKPYLNPKFSVQDLINDLGIPKHHVYYCFNNIIQNKFTIIKSELRVNYAKKLLKLKIL
jgi:hypothetical protein